jgi:hypothetical protein
VEGSLLFGPQRRGALSAFSGHCPILPSTKRTKLARPACEIQSTDKSLLLGETLGDTRGSGFESINHDQLKANAMGYLK